MSRMETLAFSDAKMALRSDRRRCPCVGRFFAGLWLKCADRLCWRDKKGETEMGKLDGKVAIVTGAGRGIGRAIAEAYIQEGASVTVTAAREQAELNQLAKQDGSERVLALLADVTNPEACEQIVDQTTKRFGHVD